MSKRFTLFAFIFMLPLAAMAQNSWDGTADTDWYVSSQSSFTLTTSEQLAGLAKLVNSGTSFSGKTIYLGSNMDLSYNNWTPIGGNSYSFNGTFDGDGYVVRNLSGDCTLSANSLSCPNNQFDYKGLFGRSSGTIRNLGVTGVDIVGQNYVGGLVGYNSGKITNCYSRVSVTANTQVGGLVGYNSSGTINNSYSAGLVTASGVTRGGFIGVNSGTVSGGYYDSDVSEQEDTGRGIPKTTYEMKREETFEGWNFYSTWGIRSSINNGYPHLFGSFVPPSSSSTGSSSNSSSSSTCPKCSYLPFWETFEGSQTLNGWTLSNDDNRWTISSTAGSSGFGTHSAYISYSGYSYSTRSSISHLYKDIAFPESSEDFTLSYDFKGMGENGYDYMEVRYSDVTISPSRGTEFAAGTLLATNFGISDWEKQTITLPAADFSGKEKRFVFTWKNNATDGTQPPAAIDNVCINIKGKSCISVPATLPFVETFENGLNGWILVNGVGTEKWMIGTSAAFKGSHSAYISNNNLDNLYSNSNTYVHIYRDITFPESSEDFNLRYAFRGVGRGNGYAQFDQMDVSYSDITYEPAVGSSNFFGITNLATNRDDYSWQMKTVPLPAAIFSGKTKRFIFTWFNSGSNIAQPPAAIDDICIYAAGDISSCNTGGNTSITMPVISETFENGLNGWVVSNGTQTNKWMIGTATASNGSYSAYISNNHFDNLYSNSATYVYLYKDITFPESSEDFILRYDFKGMGESGYDYMEVQYSDTNYTPREGDLFGPGVSLVRDLGDDTWLTKTITLPAENFSGRTLRLIFRWRNDGSTDNQPPAAIDNICIYTPSNMSSCNLPPIKSSLPFAETFENGENKWVFINGTQTNKWIIGTATKNSGSRSAYISNNGSANTYTVSNASSIVHLYRDFVFPESSENFVLTYYFKGMGEEKIDYMTVSYHDTENTPVAGSFFSGATILDTVALLNNWEQRTVALPAADFSEKNLRLVFTWRNNAAIGTQPPAAIDDINIYMVDNPLKSSSSSANSPSSSSSNEMPSSSSAQSSSSNETSSSISSSSSDDGTPSSSSSSSSSSSDGTSSSSSSSSSSDSGTPEPSSSSDTTITIQSSSSSDGASPVIISRIASGQTIIQATSNAILLENLPSNAKVQIYNLKGRRIYSNNNHENPLILKIMVQTKGLYIIKINNAVSRVVVR
jgi:hypothetical protein